MNKVDDERIKELNRIIYVRSEIIKVAKRDIKNAKKEKELLENKNVQRKRKK